MADSLIGFGTTASDPGKSPGLGPRLHRQVFALIEKQIATGEAPPGTELLEAELTRRLGVGRAPVRRALADLAAAGHIRKSSGRGYVVRGRRRSGSRRKESEVAQPRLSYASAWERLYAEVEREVASRSAFGRWRIPETKLARFYGVSRTVARDLLARLERVGLVKKDRATRWYVPALSAERVGELYEMRRLLEPAALIKAAQLLSPEYLADMRRELEDALERFPDVDAPLLNHLERRLHVDFLSHCGNQMLLGTLQHCQALLIAHSFLYSKWLGAPATDPFLREHLEIVVQVEGGRVDVAASLLDRHLHDSLARANERIGVVAGKFRPDPLPYLIPLLGGTSAAGAGLDQGNGEQ